MNFFLEIREYFSEENALESSAFFLNLVSSGSHNKGRYNNYFFIDQEALEPWGYYVIYLLLYDWQCFKQLFKSILLLLLQ